MTIVLAFPQACMCVKISSEWQRIPAKLMFKYIFHVVIVFSHCKTSLEAAVGCPFVNPPPLFPGVNLSL